MSAFCEKTEDTFQFLRRVAASTSRMVPGEHRYHLARLDDVTASVAALVSEKQQFEGLWLSEYADGEIGIFVERLPWDSSFFGRTMLRAYPVSRGESNSQAERWLSLLTQMLDDIDRRLPGTHITLPVPADCVPLHNASSACGFAFTGQFAHMVGRPKQLAKARAYESVIDLSGFPDLDRMLQAFARECKFPSRFSRDPSFSDGEVEGMNLSWLKSLCDSRLAENYARGVVVDGRLVGFAGGSRKRLSGNGKEKAYISGILSGAVPGSGSRGFQSMSTLCNGFQADCFTEAVISTSNTAAIRMVEMLGFRLCQATSQFHRRSPQ